MLGRTDIGDLSTLKESKKGSETETGKDPWQCGLDPVDRRMAIARALLESGCRPPLTGMVRPTDP